MAETTRRPLEGIRVLAMEQFISGPSCSMILADMGAEVIKIERPKVGDPRRHFPPFAENERGEKIGGGFMCFNRSKKSLTLNTKAPEGLHILKELIKISDVLLENFRPDTMPRMGLTYQVMQELNPRLIYATLSGFGRLEEYAGPYSDWPAFDTVLQAMGGSMNLTGLKDGKPLVVEANIVDVGTSVFTALGIMFALYDREKTGKGRFVDISMYETMATLCQESVMMYAFTGESPERGKEKVFAPIGAFKVKDGYVAFRIPTEDMWQRTCQAIEREDLIEHPKTCTGVKRAANMDFLGPILDEWFAQRTKAEAVARFQECGVPLGPVQNAEEISHCEHLEKRKAFAYIDDPVAGRKKLMGNPFKLSGMPDLAPTPPPRLGEHNHEILRTLLGYSDEKILDLEQKGVL
ncbi:predicted acyl-CoA transferases/carnitine dehydratase [Candidatus Vecturithrix granuli]|uniref:Predicted acyl-CoA transferases/carnitine dehydratase n=1 Tax=Vecturithrix granuli TaxID=1499967 RepID=A0A081BYC2_VECG1|nr:predicted acyl-CoA transferases/carnitine dehydratase [Candidatus Vecturithrix granuli]